MCRAGGGHCAVDLAAHNDRRRRNRLLRDVLIEWAEVQDPELDTRSWIARPAQAKRWAADNGLGPEILDAWHAHRAGSDLELVRRVANAQRIVRELAGDALVTPQSPLHPPHAGAVGGTFAVIADERTLGFRPFTRCMGADLVDVESGCWAPLNQVMAWAVAQCMGAQVYAQLVPQASLVLVDGRLGALSEIGAADEIQTWSDERVRAAALFDAVTAQRDRHRLTVGRLPGARSCLVDNTMAFGPGIADPRHSCVLSERLARCGDGLDAGELEALQHLEDALEVLRPGLGDDGADRLARRVALLRERKTLCS